MPCPYSNTKLYLAVGVNLHRTDSISWRPGITTFVFTSLLQSILALKTLVNSQSTRIDQRSTNNIGRLRRKAVLVHKVGARHAVPAYNNTKLYLAVGVNPHRTDEVFLPRITKNNKNYYPHDIKTKNVMKKRPSKTPEFADRIPADMSDIARASWRAPAQFHEEFPGP